MSFVFISGGDKELLDWLLATVFPAEAKFENEEYAKVAYDSVIDRSIASGVRDYAQVVQNSTQLCLK